MVALRDHVDTVFHRAVLGRHSPLGVRLPSHVAGCPAVWRARSGCSPGRQCSSRTHSGLLVYGEVSGVGFLRTRDCTHAGDLGGVCPPWEPGTRHDAACGRTPLRQIGWGAALGKTSDRPPGGITVGRPIKPSFGLSVGQFHPNHVKPVEANKSSNPHIPKRRKWQQFGVLFPFKLLN